MMPRNLLTPHLFVNFELLALHEVGPFLVPNYGGADKSLALPGKKQATATENFDVHISYFNHNLRNISTIYIYNKTSIKRNILTIKLNTSGSRSG